MDVEFDPAKDAANVARHGLSLAAAANFAFDGAAISEDGRMDYGETRYRAFGRVDGKGHCLVFTVRNFVIRPISFRRAHEKEMRRYGR